MNALLLAAHGLRTERIMVMFFPCVAVVAAVLAVVVYLVQRSHRLRMQRRIDQKNLLQYRKWHAMVAQTGVMQPISSPLILAKGEECLWMQDHVTLLEVRPVKRTVYTGGSMPLGDDGIRIGKAYSTSESTDEWRPVSSGQLYVTNKQIYFDGDKHDRKIPLGTVSTIKADASAIEISSATSQKSMIFLGCNGNICREIVLCVLGQEVF